MHAAVQDVSREKGLHVTSGTRYNPDSNSRAEEEIDLVKDLVENDAVGNERVYNVEGTLRFTCQFSACCKDKEWEFPSDGPVLVTLSVL